MFNLKQKVNYRLTFLFAVCVAFALLPIIAFAQNVQGENLENIEQNATTQTNDEYLYYCINGEVLSLSNTKIRDDYIDASSTLNSTKLMDVAWRNDVKNITVVDIKKIGTLIKPTGMAYWFYGMENLTHINGFENIEFHNVETVCNLFGNCKKLGPHIILNFNDNSTIKNTSCMFYGCMALQAIALHGWHTTNVTDTHSMFEGCVALENLDLRDFITESVQNMSSMFNCCFKLTNFPVRSFNTRNVTDMSGMFDGCHSLEDINFIQGWDTSKVENFKKTFAYTKINNFNVPTLLTDSATTMESMFEGCKYLTSINLSNFNTQKTTNFASMFFDCTTLTDIDVSSFDTSNAETFLCMFSGCSSLSAVDISNFNTEKVTNMNRMFEKCESLSQIDLSSLNTPNLTQTVGMFDSCKNLQEIKFGSFNTSKVDNMAHMFHACQSLQDVDLSGFDTTNVWNYAAMFEQCISLISLDLGSFDTHNAKSFESTFKDCIALETLKMSENFVIDNVQYDKEMFLHCYKIKGENGTEYDQQHIQKEYAHIDMGVTSPGYGTRAFSPTPPTPEPVNPESANIDGTAQTSDSAPFATLAVVAIASAVGAVFASRRRKFN